MTIRRNARATESRARAFRTVAVFALAIALALIVLVAARIDPVKGPSKVVDLTSLRLEIADSDFARMRGLSGRESLDADAGMLFVFGNRGVYPFWMKEMKFPLDIVWIDDGKVVDVATLQPPSPNLNIPPSHIPRGMADLVLEVNAGKAAELGLAKGAYVILPAR